MRRFGPGPAGPKRGRGQCRRRGGGGPR
jgi:hypothetical protein